MGWSPQRSSLLQPLPQAVHVGLSHDPDLLGGNIPLLLQLTDLVDLVIAGQQHGVVTVKTEHPVEGGVADHVQDVAVMFDILGALPLVDLQAGGGGEQHIGPEHIEPCEGLVALADEFALHMLKFLLQSRIVRGSGHIDGLLAPLVKFPADGAEDIPVALAVGEDGKGDTVLLDLSRLAAAEPEAQFHAEIPQCINTGAQDADENGKEHTACAGIDIKLHSF